MMSMPWIPKKGTTPCRPFARVAATTCRASETTAIGGGRCIIVIPFWGTVATACRRGCKNGRCTARRRRRGDGQEATSNVTNNRLEIRRRRRWWWCGDCSAVMVRRYPGRHWVCFFRSFVLHAQIFLCCSSVKKYGVFSVSPNVFNKGKKRKMNVCER